MYLASNLPHMQTFGKVHGNFHVPCNETFTLAWYMEISMYLAMKHTATYVEISMYLAIKHMARYIEISKYLAMKHMARYMEISMYLAMKHNARYMEISMYQLPYVSLQGTLKFPCTLQTKHMTKHSLPYVSLQGNLSVVLRKSILAAQRDIDISVDLH